MSEAQKDRTPQEIQQEYSNACLKAGNLQYELICKQNDLKLLNDRLRDLNFEFIKAKNVEAEVAKKVAEAKAAEAPAAEVIPIS